MEVGAPEVGDGADVDEVSEEPEQPATNAATTIIPTSRVRTRSIVSWLSQASRIHVIRRGFGTSVILTVGRHQTRLALSHNRGKGCAVIETANVLTALRGTRYLGSHPRASRPVEDVDIEFTESGLSMRRGRRQFGAIPWATVAALSAATWDTEERRFLAHRVLCRVVVGVVDDEQDYLFS